MGLKKGKLLNQDFLFLKLSIIEPKILKIQSSYGEKR